jgi:transposase InsO family protein
LCKTAVVASAVNKIDLRKIHNAHHFGVDKTLYLARRLLSKGVTREDADQVVRSCHICRSIDPHPVTWDHGSLEVDEVWGRLAVDVTYVGRKPYLSVVDCGPSRFAIWQQLHNETADTAIKLLKRIFMERGPAQQLLCDNGPCFVSWKMKEFLAEWGVEQVFSSAYRHSGNGIVERNHRTIKRVVARSGKSVEEAVYWYNNSPRSNGVVPAEAVYRYTPQIYGEKGADGRDIPICPRFSVGDMVYVRPSSAKCTSVWKPGRVTKVVSDQTVEVNGINRHVADLRFGWSEEQHDGEPNSEDNRPDGVEIEWELEQDASDGEDDSNSSDDADDPDVEADPRRSTRDRRLPDRYGTFVSH